MYNLETFKTKEKNYLQVFRYNESDNPFTDWDLPEGFGVDCGEYGNYGDTLTIDFDYRNFCDWSSNPSNWEDYPEEVAEFKAFQKDYYFLSVYVYDHSGVSYSSTPFSCGWDSGCAGAVFIEKIAYLKQWTKAKRATKAHETKAHKMLESYITLLDDVSNSNVWAFCLYKPLDGASLLDVDNNKDLSDCCGFEEVESCYGYWGDSGRGDILREYDIKTS